MKPIRAAIIGCGNRSRQHIEADRRIPGVEVVACCDPHEERREKLAQEYGLRAYAEARSMLAQERPDLIHLVTQPGLRVELMTLVSEFATPLCTVEKPVAVGVADWRALVELEKATRTRFAICHQFRWQEHLVKCQQALVGGALGRALFLDLSAGMNIANQGTHTLNYGRSLLGDPQVSHVSEWEIVSPQGSVDGHYGGMQTWAEKNLQAQVGFHQAVIDWGREAVREPGVSLRQSLHEWKVVLAVYTSAMTHRPVDVAVFEPDDDLFHTLAMRLNPSSSG